MAADVSECPPGVPTSGVLQGRKCFRCSNAASVQFGSEGAGKLVPQKGPVTGQEVEESEPTINLGLGRGQRWGDLLEVEPALAAQGADPDVRWAAGRDGEQEASVAVGLEGHCGHQQVADPAEVVMRDPDGDVGPSSDIAHGRLGAAFAQKSDHSVEQQPSGVVALGEPGIVEDPPFGRGHRVPTGWGQARQRSATDHWSRSSGQLFLWSGCAHVRHAKS